MAAVPFYRSLGFEEHGGKFHLLEYSGEVYIRMLRALRLPGGIGISPPNGQKP
jgi:hypothetical protein